MAFSAAVVVLLSIATARAAFTSTIDLSVPAPSICDEFLSITIDAGLSLHWSNFDFSNTRMNTLAKGLGPAFFRYGGSHGDGTIYNTNGLPFPFEFPSLVCAW